MTEGRTADEVIREMFPPDVLVDLAECKAAEERRLWAESARCAKDREQWCDNCDGTGLAPEVGR